MKKIIIAVVLVICLAAFSLPAMASTCGTGSCLQSIGIQGLSQCQQGQCPSQLQGLFNGTGCSSGSCIGALTNCNGTASCLGALTNCNGTAGCLGALAGCNGTADCLNAITGCAGSTGCFSGLSSLFQ